MSERTSRVYRSVLVLAGLAAVLTVVGLAAILMIAGGAISEPAPPSGANDPDVVAAREAARTEQNSILTKAALQEPVSVSVSDGCRRGVYSAPWGPFDGYYWQCERVTSWVVGTELEDAGALIDAYRTHLSAVGCEPDVAAFDQVESYWEMFGTVGQNVHGEIYTVDNLPPAQAQCPDGAVVSVTFGSSAGFELPEIFGVLDYEGEQIEARPHDRAAVRSSGSTLIVTLQMIAKYHEVSRLDADSDAPVP